MKTDFFRNKLIDYVMRAQSYSLPSSWYAALLTAASRSSHTEQTGGGVARVEIARSLAAWAGTQGDGTTSASSGSSGVTSNNAQIQFAASASAEISASYVGLFDAASSGNLCMFFPLVDGDGNPITRTWYASDPVRVAAANLRITEE